MALDPGSLLQASGGLSGQSGSVNAVARLFPGVTRRSKEGRLTRSRHSADELDPALFQGNVFQGSALLVTQVPILTQC